MCIGKCFRFHHVVWRVLWDFCRQSLSGCRYAFCPTGMRGHSRWWKCIWVHYNKCFFFFFFAIHLMIFQVWIFFLVCLCGESSLAPNVKPNFPTWNRPHLFNDILFIILLYRIAKVWLRDSWEGTGEMTQCKKHYLSSDLRVLPVRPMLHRINQWSPVSLNFPLKV